MRTRRGFSALAGIVLVAAFGAAPPLLAQGTIETLAGGGAGDGGPATLARLGQPSGLAVDAAGYLFIADALNHVIRKVGADGTITTIAGTGLRGSAGDGGPAVLASIAQPYGVAVDAAGNVYIADTDNSRIRKVAPNGTITRFAGTGPGFGGDGGPATSAQIRKPMGVEVDPLGNVYIADWENHRIRKVNPTGTITTVAGTGVSGYSGDGGPATLANLNYPRAVAADGSGSFYIVDAGNTRVRKVDPAGTITTVAGTGVSGYSGDGGPATLARLASPFGLELDASGNLYIVDTGNQRVRKVDTSGVITTFAGNGYAGSTGDGGPATAARFNSPHGVAVDPSGVAYISEYHGSRVRRVDTAGKITLAAGAGPCGGDGGPATAACLTYVTGVAVDGSGSLYIADRVYHRIRKVSPTGTITTVAGSGIYGYSGDGGPATAARMYHPSSVAVDAAGNLFIADTFNLCVRKVNAGGTITTAAGTGGAGYSGDGGPANAARLRNPTGVAVDSSGNLFIADSLNHCVRKVDAGGTITTVAGTGVFGYSGDGGPAIAARLAYPEQLAVDNLGNLYIADQGNERIRKVDAGGTITTVAGTGVFGYFGDGGPAIAARLAHPTSVAVDAWGRLQIADAVNHRIRQVDLDGTITTVAGTGDFGFAGDGGPATAAWLSNPHGVATDGSGRLYIADMYNFRVRRVLLASPNEPPVAVAGPDQVLETTSPDGASATLDGSGSHDPDDDTLNCTWTGPFGTLSGMTVTATLPVGSSIVTLTVDDGQGATATDELLVTVEDTTNPDLVVTPDPPPNAAGWNNSDVTLTASCEDSGTGVASPPTSPQTVSSEAAGQVVSFSCTDHAGNSVTRTVTVNLDKTAPSVLGEPVRGADHDGWYNHPLDVVWSGADGLSGIAACDPAGTYAGPDSAAASVSGSCRDIAGNSGHATFALAYDATAPTATVTTPPDGAIYLLDAVVTADYGCSDGLSGIDACAGPVPDGGNLPTASVGSHEFAVSATDRAGNTTTLHHDYAVQYRFVGFLQPIDNLPVLNIANAGRVIPVKWRLETADGSLVSDLGSFLSLLSAIIGCEAAPSDIVEEDSASGRGSDLEYDAVAGQFIYQWRTEKTWAGRCIQMQLTLTDGTRYSAKFRFK